MLDKHFPVYNKLVFFSLISFCLTNILCLALIYKVNYLNLVNTIGSLVALLLFIGLIRLGIKKVKHAWLMVLSTLMLLSGNVIYNLNAGYTWFYNLQPLHLTMLGFMAMSFGMVLIIFIYLVDQRKEKFRIVAEQNVVLENRVERRTEQLKSEKKKSDDLLRNILPDEIAQELKEHGRSKARLYNEVSVLFTDFVNFTGISESLAPEELVSEIDFCFRAFDEIIERNGLEKIKTIGDAYLAVCGLPIADPANAVKVIRASLEIIEFMNNNETKFEVRIGVNSGPVVAGIVGVKKYAYDIWGDTVNVASRMESNSAPGKVNISGATYELIKNDFNCEYRGKIEAKNKGMIDMYFVSGQWAVGSGQ